VRPALKNFSLTPGVGLDYPFTFYQGSPGSLNPVDLTEGSALLSVNDGGGNVIFQLTSEASQPNSGVYLGGSEHAPTNGIIDIVITAADIAGFLWKYATYVMTVTTTSLGDQEVLYGAFTIVGFLP
jgi:hypothetical protein